MLPRPPQVLGLFTYLLVDEHTFWTRTESGDSGEQIALDVSRGPGIKYVPLSAFFSCLTLFSSPPVASSLQEADRQEGKDPVRGGLTQQWISSDCSVVYPHLSLVWMKPLKMNLPSTRDRVPKWCTVPLQLSFALQNSPSSVAEYEKSLQFDEQCLSVMLAEWKQTSSVRVYKVRVFTTFSALFVPPPLQGEWNSPTLWSGKWGDTGLLSYNALGSQFCFQVQPEGSKRTGRVSVACTSSLMWVFLTQVLCYLFPHVPTFLNLNAWHSLSQLHVSSHTGSLRGGGHRGNMRHHGVASSINQGSSSPSAQAICEALTSRKGAWFSTGNSCIWSDMMLTKKSLPVD